MQELGPTSAGLPRHIDVVFDRDRNATQRLRHIGGGRLLQRSFHINGQVGAQGRIACLNDLGEIGHDVGGRDLLGDEPLTEGGDGFVGEIHSA